MDAINLSLSEKLTIQVPIQSGFELVELWPERAVFLPNTRQLLVADLHWGKDEAFRYHGIPIPYGVLNADLERLTQLIKTTHAQEVMVLGDLIHSYQGLSSAVVQEITDWRQLVPVEMTLIRGNHDRHCSEFPKNWLIHEVVEPMILGPFAYSHHPNPVTSHFVWAGHLHPTVQLYSSGDRLRLPCFHLSEQVGILPAFSLFTGGYNMQKQLRDRIFAIADTRVIEI